MQKKKNNEKIFKNKKKIGDNLRWNVLNDKFYVFFI